MAATDVLIFCDSDGTAPVLDWLRTLQRRDRRGFRKCVHAIDLLRQFGNELRRPHADLLRDGVYELRARAGRVNYRILYGFVGKDVALLTSGLTKEKTIASSEIDRALTRLQAYRSAPDVHGLEIEII